MIVRDALESDLPGVLAIYNDAVLHTTAIWNDTVVDLANRRVWWKDRLARQYPVLVATEGDCVLGYASFGDWRPFDGYRHTVEHSVYIHRDHRRRGIARSLMQPLIQKARELGKHVMIAGIEAGNDPSIRLHTELGFQATARMPQVGMKFGKWLDLIFMQLRLNDRASPDQPAPLGRR